MSLENNNEITMSTNDLTDPKDQNLANSEGTMDSSSLAEQENEPVALERIEISNQLGDEPQGIHFDTSTTVKSEGESAEATNIPVNELELPAESEELEEVEDIEDGDEEVDEESEEIKIDSVDFSSLTKDEMVQTLKKLINEKPIQKIKAEVESIKSIFYRKHKLEVERLRREFVEAGGDVAGFTPPEDDAEIQIKELLKLYREKRAQYNGELEVQKKQNLELKMQIIEQIKDLVNSSEAVNVTFQEFRNLQQKFREVGPVPQANLNDLWENYHHHVQNFYDYIKINKELRDLDLKKNLEEKIKLCEKAEELLLEPSVVAAFKKLQKYHTQWREVGPVPHENQNEIWERFKEATAKINKKHQEYFESLRDEQKRNLDAKAALCEKAEELASLVIKTNKEWNQRSKEMVELQKVWKTIGFAPKKDNNKVYERFRAACDTFFNNKRDFYSETKEDQLNNLQLKTELCIQAESLKDSTEWKKTTEDFINLQKRWKEIGPVPRKNSDEIWKRFRAACDYFFTQKSSHFSQVDNSYDKNLKDKEMLIAEIAAYQLTDNPEADLLALKDFQRRWAEVGFVPIKNKEDIQKRYREAINKHFETLNIGEEKRNMFNFKTKLESATGNPRQENKLRQERDKFFNRLRQLEGDIALWENNIGFFTRSKNAEAMIKEVERKIEKAKEEIRILEQKIKMIDSMDSK